MKRLLLCLLIGFLLGCAAEHESIDKLSSDSQSGAEKFSESETQNVLIFNESSAFVSESEGSWNLELVPRTGTSHLCRQHPNDTSWWVL